MLVGNCFADFFEEHSAFIFKGVLVLEAVPNPDLEVRSSGREIWRHFVPSHCTSPPDQDSPLRSRMPQGGRHEFYRFCIMVTETDIYRLCHMKLCCPSLIALFPVMFHSANFWKIQIFIDSNLKLTTPCCYPYISLWSFSKLIHDNMGFGLWWVRFGSDTLPWHMVSSFMILWCRLMRHQSFKFKLQMAVTYIEATQRNPMDGENDDVWGFPLSA
jgi:hypothetical protein